MHACFECSIQCYVTSRLQSYHSNTALTLHAHLACVSQADRMMASLLIFYAKEQHVNTLAHKYDDYVDRPDVMDRATRTIISLHLLHRWWQRPTADPIFLSPSTNWWLSLYSSPPMET